MQKDKKSSKKKLLTYKEYFKKYFGKRIAKDILFGWFDYKNKHNIK